MKDSYDSEQHITAYRVVLAVRYQTCLDNCIELCDSILNRFEHLRYKEKFDAQYVKVLYAMIQIELFIHRNEAHTKLANLCNSVVDTTHQNTLSGNSCL